jgi:lipoprotein-anchoring transpeptidase ErfK/SrfK
MKMLTIFSFTRRQIGAEYQTRAQTICFPKSELRRRNKRRPAALVEADRNRTGRPVFRSTLAAAAWLVLFTAVAEAREPRAATWDKIAGGRQAEKPVLAVVSLRQQKITVYDSAGPILEAPVSTGSRTYDTPAGIFTILQKNRDHVSNLYEDAEMPFMQRITWSGIALHAGALPGYRASHGCIRLPYRFAERLFDLTSVGTRVVIAPSKVDAMRVSHPLLDRLQRDGATATSASGVEQAREAATKAREEAEKAAARAEKVATAARRAEAVRARAVKRLSAAIERVASQKSGPAKVRAEAQVQKLRADASVATAAADAATKLAQPQLADLAAAENKAREARLRAWPVSILVSLKTQRIYVRQGFEPVLEMPAVIKDPQRPIGTHAFYATETAQGERGWLSVGLTKEGKSDGAGGHVLDRIEIPQEVTEKLASSTWLGSALIVSDEAPYKETAAGTDFLVVLSNEPQGALKIRSPDESRPTAQVPGLSQPVRAYRAPQEDQHFRHPLGSFP